MVTFDNLSDENQQIQGESGKDLIIQEIHDHLNELSKMLEEGDTKIQNATEKLQNIRDNYQAVQGESTRPVQGESTRPTNQENLPLIRRWLGWSKRAGEKMLCLFRGKNKVDSSSTRSREVEASNPNETFLENELRRYRNDNKDTLAHTAATFHSMSDFLETLIELCPNILLEERKGELNGQTSLHVAIATGKTQMVTTILNCASKDFFLCSKLLKTAADGSRFQNTVMLGQLPLSVAALSLNENTVDLLIDKGAKIDLKNKDGEIVLHSLIRYAGVNQNTDAIWRMMEHIHEKLPVENKLIWHDIENKDGVTPLKLAVSLGLKDLFMKILSLDEVYHDASHHEGLFGIHLYDVTELDTVTQAEWERFKKLSEEAKWKESQQEEANQVGDRHEALTDVQHEPELFHTSPAILDIICQVPSEQAFQFFQVDVVRQIVRVKWRHYKKFFYVWLVCHVAVMIHITIFAVYKTDILNSDLNSSKAVNKTETIQKKRDFVNATSGFVIIYALFYLLLEATRSLYFGQVWKLKRSDGNGVYRLMLCIFSVALLIDSIWFYSHPHNNYFLIVALILGWTFMAFFLRVYERFSFYTVLYVKIVWGDLLRLSVFIMFQMVGFSTSVYITYKNSENVPSNFKNFADATVTMFKIMLCLAELDFLYEARERWLAIGLYIVFVLGSYVVLINSLIAMMSRMCTMISKDGYNQWKLQRLLVILMLETMLLPSWRYHLITSKEELEHYHLAIHQAHAYLEVINTCTRKNMGNRSVLETKSTKKPEDISSHCRQQEVDITRTHICTDSCPEQCTGGGH